MTEFGPTRFAEFSEKELRLLDMSFYAGDTWMGLADDPEANLRAITEELERECVRRGITLL
jgi:hypothetical protein